MIISGIIEIDVHGMNVETAISKIEKLVVTAPTGTYRIRVIHGFNGGTKIKNAIRRELGYGLVPQIKRIECGTNEGISELVLREYF